MYGMTANPPNIRLTTRAKARRCSGSVRIARISASGLASPVPRLVEVAPQPGQGPDPGRQDEHAQARQHQERRVPAEPVARAPARTARPTTVASAKADIKAPVAAPRFSSGKTSAMIAIARPPRMPPNAPVTTRAARSVTYPGARPQQSVPTRNPA